MNTTLSIAFLAGLISFLSPCVLPLIPGYISYISGTSLDKIKDRKKNLIFIKTIFFTLGFSFVLRFGGEYALIEDFIVHAGYRGWGLASLLLRAAMAEARQRGCSEVQVNGPSEEGLPVYIKNGFIETGDHLKAKINIDA